MATKTLAKLKGEMLFNSDLTRLVSVMKDIAAAQYQVMERNRTHFDRYRDAVDEIVKSYDFRRSKHPFIRQRSDKKLVCLVTTDFGFLGGLNMKVVQNGMKLAEKGTHYLVLGDRGVNYIKEYGGESTAFEGINIDATRYDLVEKVIRKMKEMVLKQKFGRVVLIYPKSIAFATQRIESLNLIPCPIFFKDKPPTVPTQPEQSKQIILESSPNEVVDYLTTLWLRHRLIECFESAKMSEFGARTMHLEESSQTLSKINKQLKLQYFKARREKIDQSLRETFTSQLICE
ncbi:MAG: F0F1 ATP synthase subunit gamma [Candidatus Omnitrophica bacterium]|nr:F0F1 ATP synthase subunit gamma [Candidatus Omnitrophota bacterium]